MKNIFAYFIKDKLLVNLLIVIIIVVGILSMRSISREIYPSTDMDTMIIRVSYPGANARDVEINAVVAIEDALENISGLGEYSAMITDGSAMFRVDIDEDASDPRAVKDEVFRSISLSSLSDISEDVETITVTEMNPKRIPVTRYAIVPKKDLTRDELFAGADLIERIVKKTEGVSEVTKSGYLDKVVRVYVDPLKMEDAFVAITDVITSISKRNVWSSSGKIENAHEETNILTVGSFDDPLEVGNVIIRSGFEQEKVRVSDIATIVNGYDESDVRIRANGRETVILTVRRKENADTIAVVDALKKELAKNSELYSDSFDIVPIMDISESIRSQIKILVSNALIGFALVIALLLLFLDLKTSFWTAFSIPLCLLIVMIFMRATGITINTITLGAIITVLGMLVDDAIVVAETIFSKKEAGVEPKKAALDGVYEVIAPVTVTILSTIVAFMPLMMVKGKMGKFIYLYPVVIAVTLLASLAEAATMLPNHLANGKKRRVSEDGNHHKPWFAAMLSAYKKILSVCLKWRYGVLAGFVLLFVFSVLFSLTSMRKFKLRDRSVSEEIVLDLDAPSGTSLDEMEKLTATIEQKLQTLIREDELKSMLSYVGQHSNSRHEGNRSNWTAIDIMLTPQTKRHRSTREILRELREKMDPKSLEGTGITKLVFREQRRGPEPGDAIDLRVISSNEEHLAAVVDKLQSKLSEIDGITDITSDLESGDKEIHIRFDYDKLSEFGLTVSDVSTTVRAAYSGTEASSIQSLDDELTFEVSLSDEHRTSAENILKLLIETSDGNLVKLGDVAHIEYVTAQASIVHYNGERTQAVSADVNETILTPMEANQKIATTFPELMKEYPDVTIQARGEMEETRTALSGLLTAFIAALIMIYLIVLFLFRSVGKPLIVLSAVPFGMIGVLLAFRLHGMSITFMAIIGIIGLSGVVINDSIIMVEFITKHVSELKSNQRLSALFDAVIEGASRRLRPIILTTVTTVAGLLPTVYGIGGDIGTLKPTVMAMSYGLLFATLLTLFFVPALYMIGKDVKRLLGGATR